MTRNAAPSCHRHKNKKRTGSSRGACTTGQLTNCLTKSKEAAAPPPLPLHKQNTPPTLRATGTHQVRSPSQHQLRAQVCRGHDNRKQKNTTTNTNTARGCVSYDRITTHQERTGAVQRRQRREAVGVGLGHQVLEELVQVREGRVDSHLREAPELSPAGREGEKRS